MLKVLYLIVLISGAVMGAGFVSGSELWLFFGRYSTFAIPLLFIFALIFYTGILKVMNLKNKYNINTLDDLCMLVMPVAHKYISIIIKLSYFIFASAMLSGIRLIGGEYMVLCVILITFFIVILNKQTLLKLNLFLVPVVVIFLTCLFFNCEQSIGLSGNADFNLLFGGIGVLCYAGVNLLLVYGAIVRSYNTLSKKATIIVAFVSTCILILLAIIVLLIIGSNDYALFAMPIGAVAFDNGAVFSIVGECIIVSSIFTTFLSCVFGVNSGKRSALETIISLTIIYLFSFVGFIHILELAYLTVGIFSIVFYLAVIRKV